MQMKIVLGVESANYSLGNVSNQGFIRQLVCRNVVLFFGEKHCWLRS